jgi:hypothetical protein
MSTKCPDKASNPSSSPTRLRQRSHPPGPRHLEAVDLVHERLELRRLRRALITRRPIRAQRTPDRVAIDSITPRQLLDRHPANEMLAPQLGPPLHLQHTPSPGLDRSRPSQAQHPRGRLRPAPQRGCIFSRRRRVSFPPAPTQELGADPVAGSPSNSSSTRLTNARHAAFACSTRDREHRASGRSGPAGQRPMCRSMCRTAEPTRGWWPPGRKVP